jgi:hypothetical protein
MAGRSLLAHLGTQLENLAEIVGADSEAARKLLADLLGSTDSHLLSEPPAWPSDVSDDHTPVEFSVAFNEEERPTLRILGEALGARPSPAANLLAAHRFLRTQAARFNLSMSQFDRVRDVFATQSPEGEFGIWHSMVFRNGRPPEFKVYFNPELIGVRRAPSLVAEALDRLGLAGSYRTALAHSVRPGELGRADRLTFFALDLHDGPHARVKLYLTHHDAQARDLVRAASTVDDIDTDEIIEFCRIAGGGTVTFGRRPLVGSYTFLGGVDRPVGFSIYVPIRDYVVDDGQARDRVVALLERYGFGNAEFDRILAAVTPRPLHAGVGLIAHVSLRLGPPRPGITVYLSAEAYEVSPPRDRRPADCEQPQRPASRYAA